MSSKPNDDRKKPKHPKPNRVQVCPDCGTAMTPEGGCWTCQACGCSLCG